MPTEFATEKKKLFDLFTIFSFQVMILQLAPGKESMLGFKSLGQFTLQSVAI